MSFFSLPHETNELRDHADNGEARGNLDIDTIAKNRGRNGFLSIDVGAVVIASLRGLSRRFRKGLNVRILCLDICSRRAGLSSILDYERAVCNALADLEKQGCIVVLGGLFHADDTPNLAARVSMTRLMM